MDSALNSALYTTLEPNSQSRTEKEETKSQNLLFPASCSKIISKLFIHFSTNFSTYNTNCQF